MTISTHRFLNGSDLARLTSIQWRRQRDSIRHMISIGKDQ